LKKCVPRKRRRNAGGIRGDDRGGLHQRFDTREERLLRLRLFDDGFADPIALGEELQVIVGVARAHTRDGRRLHERRGLTLAGLQQTVLGGGAAIRRSRIGITGDVEQNDAAARRRRKGRDATAHGAGANHADSRDAHSGISPWGTGETSA
jgi:hypothetical protein